ncbi:MAG: hypothetical protein IJL32_16710 [Oscillospiraceae bacterium]|nr:hypothetical protein [Oscillospiraceae bacterium]
MKRTSKKAASILAAALLGVTAAQGFAMTASATTLTPFTQYAALGQSYRMIDFVRHECMKFPTNKYWNTGNVDTCSSSPRDVTTQMTGGTVVGRGHTILPANQTPSTLTGSAAFARKLAYDYFETNYYVRIGSNKNFKLHSGDQVTVRGWNGNSNALHTVFVLDANATGDYSFADCTDAVDTCRINWNNKCFTHNGSFIVRKSNGATTAYSIDHVDRPLMAGDVNGDTVVDGSDASAFSQLRYGQYDLNNKNYNFIRAAADLNRDYNFTVDDYAYFQMNNGYMTNLGFITYLY